LRLGKETERICTFILDIVDQSSARGAVVAMSGGVDSAVVGALCVKALGKRRVLALLMPSDHTPEQDVSDAKKLAEGWGVKWEVVPITAIVDRLVDAAKVEGTRIAKGNAEARVRMATAYYYANSIGYIVAGTGDRSESILGYFTKWGDGGVDMLPIVHLFKTQVRQLGVYLGLPKEIVEKPASPQLWPGHKASDEIPAGYDKVDVLLHCVYDLRLRPAEAARKAGVPVGVLDKVLEMHARTEHKRNLPPSLSPV